MTKRNRPGPKPRAAKSALGIVALRVTEDERRRWNALAERQGMSLSAAIRQAMDTAWARGSTR